MPIRLSCDDACSSDMRVAELALKHRLNCIFYWPVEWHSLAYSKGYEPLSYADASWIADRFEIGSHGITHRHLTQIPLSEALYEIEQSKTMLEDLFGLPVDSFAPPRGYTNPELTKHTLVLYDTQRLTKQDGLVHVHPNSGANGNKPWRDCVNQDTKEIFMHSWELDKFDLWDELEAFLHETARS